MIRIPLPNWLLATVTVAFLYLFGWHMEQKNAVCAGIGMVCSVWCIAELVQRLVEHFRDRRKP